MKEVSVEAGDGQVPTPADDAGLQNKDMKISRVAYNEYEEIGEKPTRFEVWGWYLYEFCSYFVQTVLIPIVFPLIISQLQQLPTDPVQEWVHNHQGMVCAEKEITLKKMGSAINKARVRLPKSWKAVFFGVQQTHKAHNKCGWLKLLVFGVDINCMGWWSSDLVLVAPILAFTSFHLDGQFQTLITAASTGIGVFFCLPTGFFKTTKIFIPYIATIVMASTVASAAHTQNLGLMIRAFVGPTLKKNQISIRHRVSSWLSLYATSAGCLGAAIISSFTYHMLREPNERDFISLWIVSIFSGLIWLVGLLHVATSANRNTDPISFSSTFHPLSIFRYPHAIGGLFGVFLSSFATMSIFTGGVLFIVGQLCIRPVHLLYFWLIYFLFPIASMPLLQPLQQFIKSDSVKMQIMGFLLSLFSSGFEFYFWDSHWKWGQLLIFGAIQSTASGILLAFGRVLVLDCAPYGKEGAFSVWYAWMRAAGLCGGFTMGSVVTRGIRTSFGATFCTAIVGIVVLLFGNVSDVGGAVAAGHVREDDSEIGSNVRGLDSKESISV